MLAGVWEQRNEPGRGSSSRGGEEEGGRGSPSRGGLEDAGADPGEGREEF
jgi:hypothetical protein